MIELLKQILDLQDQLRTRHLERDLEQYHERETEHDKWLMQKRRPQELSSKDSYNGG
jgi:hypothetical protein